MRLPVEGKEDQEAILNAWQADERMHNACNSRVSFSSQHCSHGKCSNHGGPTIHKSPLQCNMHSPFPIQNFCSVFLGIPARPAGIRWVAIQEDNSEGALLDWRAVWQCTAVTETSKKQSIAIWLLTIQNVTDCK